MNSTILLLATFDDSYPGSDFCRGVQFGIHGSNLLINIVKSSIDKTAQIDPLGGAQRLGVNIIMP